jgi:hypothetical protein
MIYSPMIMSTDIFLRVFATGSSYSRSYRPPRRRERHPSPLSVPLRHRRYGLPGEARLSLVEADFFFPRAWRRGRGPLIPAAVRLGSQRLGSQPGGGGVAVWQLCGEAAWCYGTTLAVPSQTRSGAPSGFGWAGLPMTAVLPADGGDGVARTGVAELAASLLQCGGGNFAGPIWAQLVLVCSYCRVRSATASAVEDVPPC